MTHMIRSSVRFFAGLCLAVPTLLGGCGQEPPSEALTQEPAEPAAAAPHPGEAPYWAQCANCHEGGTYKAPHRVFLSMMGPDAILESMNGVMATQSAGLTDQQKKDISEFLAGRPVGSETVAYPPPRCEDVDLDMDQPPRQIGWGIDILNSRFQTQDSGALTAEDIGELQLKWTFAYPNAIQARSQPTIAGGTVFIGSQSGVVYALDARTGCLRWSFRATAEVRTAIVISDWEAGDQGARPRAFFGDILARAYALDARTGELLWIRKVDGHPNATMTAAPVLVNDRLFVPVSSLEVAAAAEITYSCCTFRGSMVALKPETGDLIWKTYTIDQPPAHVGDTSAGTAIMAPSGAPIWNSPTVDLKRGQIYAGTGENYSSPAEGSSDAIIAFDMGTGVKRWVTQATAGDAWNAGCLVYYTDDPANCPEENGPDFDFSAPPILVALNDADDILVAGQKSGEVMGIDPDNGEILWRRQVGRGGVQGGVHFSMAADGTRIYVPINDMFYPEDLTRYNFEMDPRPGIFALNAETGEEIWAQLADNVCPADQQEFCDPGISAAITAIPGAVIAGHMDGRLRIYADRDGRLLWEFNSLKEFETLSGETARGGSMSGGGPAVADGMLYMNSGYGIYQHMPGNVLMAFGLPGPGDAL